MYTLWKDDTPLCELSTDEVEIIKILLEKEVGRWERRGQFSTAWHQILDRIKEGGA